MPSGESTPYVGPEFLHHVCKSVRGELDGELLKVLMHSPRVGIVSIGDADNQGVPDHFGKVEPCPAGVGACDKNSGGCICCTLPERPGAAPEVPRIFVKEARH